MDQNTENPKIRYIFKYAYRTSVNTTAYANFIAADREEADQLFEDTIKDCIKVITCKNAGVFDENTVEPDDNNARASGFGG